MNQPLLDRIKANPPAEWQSITLSANEQDLLEVASAIQNEALHLVFMATYVDTRAMNLGHLDSVFWANRITDCAAIAMGMTWKEVFLP